MSTKYQLPNGLTVILNPSHKSPVVSVQMWVRTGSADEKKGEEGISHFIEHLVFKGTEKYGVGEIAEEVEGAGGSLNAYTSFDQTVFHVTISKQYKEVAMDVISQMMGSPSFDPDEIDNEREVVIEEIKRGADSSSRCASQLLFKNAYKKHPYSIPVIGYEKNIRKVTRKTLVDYFNSRYVPKNMFLVISGDFELPAMKKEVKKYFASMQSYKLRKVVRSKEEKQLQPRIVVEKSNFKETFIHLGWKIPKSSHSDIPLLDVLSLILGQGDSSRLTKRMRLDSSLVNSVYAGTFSPKEKGLFLVSAMLNAQNIGLFLEALNEELEKLFKDYPSREELQKAIVNISADEFYGMETVDGLSRSSGHFEFLLGDHKYFSKYLEKVNQINLEGLRKIAKKYLQPENLVVTVLSAEDSEISIIKSEIKKWQKSYKFLCTSIKKKQKSAIAIDFNKTSKKTSKKSSKGKVEKISLGEGSSVFFMPSDDTQTLNVKAAHLGGVRIENPNEGGITSLLGCIWDTGTETRNESMINKDLDNMASSIGAFSGRNTVGIGLSTLAPFEGKASELFCDIVTNPSFSKDVFEREKSVAKEMLKSRNDNPAQVGIQTFMEKIFLGHPYARDPKGDTKSLDKLDDKKLRRHWQKMSVSSNLMGVVTGAMDRDLWIDRFKHIKKSLRNEENQKKKHEFISLEDVESVEIFKELDKEQTHIITGVRGLTFQDKDKYILEVINSLLSGQGGRLFMELRDKASLAYSVSPLKMEGIDAGYFAAYIGCSPEKGKEAIKKLHEQLNRLCDESVSEDELSKAKRHLIGHHDIDLQKNSSVGNAILFNEIYGVSHKEIFNYAEIINQVSSQQVQKLAERLFAQNFVTVAVGAESPF